MSLAGTMDIASTPEECAMVDYVSSILNAQYRHTPTTFHQFKSLPVELRIKVLGCVERQPRIILEDTIHRVVRFAEVYGVPPLFEVFPQTLDLLPKQYLRLLSNEQRWVSFDRGIIFLSEDLFGLATRFTVGIFRIMRRSNPFNGWQLAMIQYSDISKRPKNIIWLVGM
jgi:hypothetical protein